jgi:hypothetical protein
MCLKKQAEILGSRLKGWNFLHKDTEICFFCTHQNKFKEFFSQKKKKDLVFCNDVIQALGHQHNPTEWHLFIDSSKVSLKAVLLCT